MWGMLLHRRRTAFRRQFAWRDVYCQATESQAQADAALVAVCGDLIANGYTSTIHIHTLRLP